MNFLRFLGIVVFFLGIVLSPVVLNAGGDETGSTVMVGWLETVYLPDYNFSLRGKIDTGAKNSSLHATDMEFISVEGRSPQSRIRFTTVDTDGKTRTIEADIIREVRIKKSALASDTPLVDARVEIELLVCVAGVIKPIQVNLSNREGMNYHLILGRTALEGDFIVDVSQKFLGGKRCSGTAHGKKPAQETME